MSNMPNSVVEPAVQNVQTLQIQGEHLGHILMHVILAVFIYIFIPVLSRSCFTFRTPDDQKIEELFYFLLVYVL